MFRFPWSNFHELNLDWILEVVKEAKEIFVNGRGDIDNAVETANEALEVAEQAAAAVIADGSITIPKLNNEVLKTTAYVIVGNRADEAVPAGAYVYLRNSLVSGLVDGIYTAAVNIPAGALVTPAEFQQSTELHDSGSLNVLKNTLNNLGANNVAYDPSETYTAGTVGIELSQLIGKFKIVSSGSLHDITDSGIYYVTGAVTDKPFGNGGLYSLSAFSSALLVGILANISGESAIVVHNGNQWSTYPLSQKITTVHITGRTTSSGAIAIPAANAPMKFLNALLTVGGSGFVFRRDSGYFTVMNNSLIPMAETDVEFDAYFEE